MDCPKCHSHMNELSGFNFTALKCGGCHGFWFQDGATDIAKAIAEAEKLDGNVTNAGNVYNSVRDFDCPSCSQKMVKMADRNQLHIKFESCAACRGVFLDAGELKDLSEFTLIEQMKQALKTFKSNIKV